MPQVTSCTGDCGAKIRCSRGCAATARPRRWRCAALSWRGLRVAQSVCTCLSRGRTERRTTTTMALTTKALATATAPRLLLRLRPLLRPFRLGKGTSAKDQTCTLPPRPPPPPPPSSSTSRSSCGGGRGRNSACPSGPLQGTTGLGLQESYTKSQTLHPLLRCRARCRPPASTSPPRPQQTQRPPPKRLLSNKKSVKQEPRATTAEAGPAATSAETFLRAAAGAAVLEVEAEA
mmetsp:Transcript_32015/g.58553  ORF Transcript_32015/g.58553 Transcript_32015/m.58553 type:complete len:233 (+) Transcript_32015:146-844(+)